MRKHTFSIYGLAALLVLAPAASQAASDPSRGLWVGEVTLNKVNETTVGINAANQVVAPDPTNTTAVASPAHLRIIFHVDGSGQVRLLKSVAVLDKSTNQTPDISLVTDQTLYPNFASIGSRIASAAFDFGDASTVQALNQVAASAAAAAAAGSNPTTAASQVVQGADVDGRYQSFVTGAGFRSGGLGAAASAPFGAIQSKTGSSTAQQVLNGAISAATNNFFFIAARSNALALQATAALPDTRYVTAVDSLAAAAANASASAVNTGNTNAGAVGLLATNAVFLAITNAINAPATVSPAYQTFVSSATFLSSASIAGAAAAASVASPSVASLDLTKKTKAAQAAALKALTDGQIFAAADAVVVNEALMTGSLSAGGTVTGSIYLGASHPTNPFRHRMHPDHSIGYPITRALTVQLKAGSSTNAFETAGFGVDRLTGTYREEISGLYKPLGTAQNIGLITDGVITLNRVSLVDTLNQ
ncbi:MAG: hypothetical protein JWR69_4275 [Pedosphaera sp.]|nr:hypothetical protein [Pedosphaera sp.]